MQQVIGLLVGVMIVGEKGIGLQMIVVQCDIDVQVQVGILIVQVCDQLQVVSVNVGVIWVVVCKIMLVMVGGVSIVIDGGNIMVLCLGELIVYVGQILLDGFIWYFVQLLVFLWKVVDIKKFNFDLWIQDVLGLYGLVLLNIFWCIVVVESGQQVLVVIDKQLYGYSDG